MLSVSRPTLQPPSAARCCGEVILRATRSFATAAKSSLALCRLSGSAAWCQRGPYSPPPRMLATTYTPPRSSQPLPTVPEYDGVSEISKPPSPYSRVGALPSRAWSFRCTLKYGTLVPSLLVADCCSTTELYLSHTTRIVFSVSAPAF